jgi:hypothetical protein
VLHTFGACKHRRNVYLVLERVRFSIKRILQGKSVRTGDETAESIDVSMQQRVVWLRDIIDSVQNPSPEPASTMKRTCPMLMGNLWKALSQHKEAQAAA